MHFKPCARIEFPDLGFEDVTERSEISVTVLDLIPSSPSFLPLFYVHIHLTYALRILTALSTSDFQFSANIQLIFQYCLEDLSDKVVPESLILLISLAVYIA